jgi:Trk K+ transport system NAD-binding subunit
VVNRELRARMVSVAYGDITQKATLEHLGVENAEIIICSVPNVLLKGMNNLRLLQMLRELTPKAKIIMNAERLADIPELYTAGADYVTTPRLLEARELVNVIDAARNKLLHELRAQTDADLKGRKEVIP